jgi:hypothetical protein
MCQFTIKATGGPAVFPIVFAKCKSSIGWEILAIVSRAIKR